MLRKRSYEKLRCCLPYGLWTCADGREVLFNRNYRPIWQRRPGVGTEKARATEWVSGITQQQWFFDDYDAPWRKGAHSKVARHRVDRALADFLVGVKILKSCFADEASAPLRRAKQAKHQNIGGPP